MDSPKLDLSSQYQEAQAGDERSTSEQILSKHVPLNNAADSTTF